jgi:hypothetical protein
MKSSMPGAVSAIGRSRGVLAVEDAHRVLLEPDEAFLERSPRCASKWATRACAPGVAGVGVAERVELERHAFGDAELLQELVGHDEELDIGLRAVGADDLGVDLVELAEAALLRALVPERGAVGGELERRVLLPAVGEVGAGDAGGEFGAQGQAVAAAILERVHLLGDDVGGLADRAGEHLRRFEHRHLDAAEGVEAAHALEGRDHRLEPVRFLAENVLGAADPLRAFAHGCGPLAELLSMGTQARFPDLPAAGAGVVAMTQSLR